VFSCSAAGSLRSAFRTLGIDDDIAFLWDQLAIGPIDPGDRRARLAWALDEPAHEDNDEHATHDEAFWRLITSSRRQLVLWMSRRSAKDSCGLREVLWRTRDIPVTVVDVADVRFTRRDGNPGDYASTSFGFVSDYMIVEERLLDRAVQVTDVDRQRYRADWHRLRTENAALRVLTSHGLVSAPLDHFDDVVRSCVTSEWQRCRYVAHEAYNRSDADGLHQGATLAFMFSRLLELIDAGVVEGHNRTRDADPDVWSMHESGVRLWPEPRDSST
jgi:hypothetical protein